MAKAVSSRRQGDEFQAIFFWGQLVNLLIDERVKTVTFESDQRIFVDDVVVEYSEELLDDQTGQQYIVDAYQCKYHVSKNTVFTVDNIISPKFIKNKEQSMLQRLYDAYKKYSEGGLSFRLHIVSSSSWDTQDPFCRFLSTENHIRTSFYEKGEQSIQGKIRSKFAAHLMISESELQHFLGTVRFDLGLNRKALAESLNKDLKYAGLIPLEKTITNTRYSELAWKWFEQGNNNFDKQNIDDLIRREKLIDVHHKSLLAIRHQSLNPIAPDAVRESLPKDLRNLTYREAEIDLTHLFDSGKLLNPQSAVIEQLKKEKEIRHLCTVNPNVELVYYGVAHIPLVFMFGHRLNVRKPIRVFEHNRDNDYWDLLSSSDTFPELTMEKTGPDTVNSVVPDAVIKFGVSYPIIASDVKQIVKKPLLVFDLKLKNPVPDVIRSAAQLENYARAFRNVLDEIHNLDVDIERIHLFYAGPVSLAFRCGQLISPTIHPKVLVYNYFSQDRPKYKWGVHVNIPPDSPEFLVEL